MLTTKSNAMPAPYQSLPLKHEGNQSYTAGVE